MPPPTRLVALVGILSSVVTGLAAGTLFLLAGRMLQPGRCARAPLTGNLALRSGVFLVAFFIALFLAAPLRPLAFPIFVAVIGA